MSDHNNDIEKLIRLKRYEKPSDGYFDDFLAEFQSRQRSELLHRSARSLFFERVGTYFSGFSRRQWVYAGSAAYAAVTVGFFLVAGLGGSGDQAHSTGPLSGTVANASGPVEQSNLLWDWDAGRVIFVEDDQIAERHDMMSSEAEWEPIMLQTSGHGVPSNFVPVKSSEGSPEATPVRHF